MDKQELQMAKKLNAGFRITPGLLRTLVEA